MHSIVIYFVVYLHYINYGKIYIIYVKIIHENMNGSNNDEKIMIDFFVQLNSYNF